MGVLGLPHYPLSTIQSNYTLSSSIYYLLTTINHPLSNIHTTTLYPLSTTKIPLSHIHYLQSIFIVIQITINESLRGFTPKS